VVALLAPDALGLAGRRLSTFAAMMPGERDRLAVRVEGMSDQHHALQPCVSQPPGSRAAGFVARPGTAIDARSLRDYMAQRAPRYMVSRYHEFVDQLPKTPTPKVEKFQLKRTGLTGHTWDAESP
jgi:acyl-CoA synthetase (AMP-forming)/AMP-acid ligase II